MKIISLLIIFNLLLAPSALAQDDYSAEYLDAIRGLIIKHYKGAVDIDKLVGSNPNEIFDQLDTYTDFFDIDEATKFFEEQDGKYGGIGIVFSLQDENHSIIKVFPLSPAEKAGLLPGDIVVKVDDINIKAGHNLEDLSNLIRGRAGSIVKISIQRNVQGVIEGNPQFIEKKIIRENIKISPVSYEIKDDFAYIYIETVNANTAEYFEQALLDIEQQGIENIILDLRYNMGGDVEQIISVARQLLPKGLISRLSYKDGLREDTEYYSYLPEKPYNLVVLINEITASAAEILAGAIQDSEVGIIIGKQSYGKAVVQGFKPILSPQAFNRYYENMGIKLVDASELSYYGVLASPEDIIGLAKITIAEYYTPNGRMIDGIGIEPDIVVDDPQVVNEVHIFSISELSKKTRYSLNSESIDVYNARKILILGAYELDLPELKLDEKTFLAIKDFQKEQGLYPYGVLDYATQDALNDYLQELRLKYDPQYAQAVELIRKHAS